MSWQPGWYGYDAKSDDHMAWGPEETPAAARKVPWADEGAPDEIAAMVISVFHIDKHVDGAA